MFLTHNQNSSVDRLHPDVTGHVYDSSIKTPRGDRGTRWPPRTTIMRNRLGPETGTPQPNNTGPEIDEPTPNKLGPQNGYPPRMMLAPCIKAETRNIGAFLSDASPRIEIEAKNRGILI